MRLWIISYYVITQTPKLGISSEQNNNSNTLKLSLALLVMDK